jgi:hypothetical protein
MNSFKFQEAKNNNFLSKLKELFESLLDKAMKGELIK